MTIDGRIRLYNILIPMMWHGTGSPCLRSFRIYTDRRWLRHFCLFFWFRWNFFIYRRIVDSRSFFPFHFWNHPNTKRLHLLIESDARPAKKDRITIPSRRCHPPVSFPFFSTRCRFFSSLVCVCFFLLPNSVNQITRRVDLFLILQRLKVLTFSACSSLGWFGKRDHPVLGFVS